jgi:hypothetical protein
MTRGFCRKREVAPSARSARVLTPCSSGR